jgi:hypothetical protein
MIRFSLCCDNDHDFEGWFRSNEDFDGQAARGLVTCPACGSANVGKALMAPAIRTAEERAPATLALDPDKREMMKALRDMVRAVKANAEDVGETFPEEARRIHHGEAKARGIYGRASREEARALIEDGIEVAPLPDLPDDLI